jgi:hypothetical protein
VIAVVAGIFLDGFADFKSCELGLAQAKVGQPQVKIRVGPFGEVFIELFKLVLCFHEAFPLSLKIGLARGGLLVVGLLSNNLVQQGFGLLEFLAFEVKGSEHDVNSGA